MTRLLSQKFRFFTFVCIGLLAYVHGYNLNDTYLAPFSAVEEPLTFTSFFEYLMANGLLRFRIPILFMISGYLYASYDHRTYKQQVRSRFRSLIIPYAIWSAFGLLFTFLLQQFPYTANIVYQTGIDQLGDNRPYIEIGWSGMAERFLLRPISYQLWFILALFFFNLIYPVIKWMVVRLPYIWLPVTFLLFFVSVVNIPLIDFRGLFFFSFGVWLQKKNVSLEKEPRWFSLGISLIVFIGLSVIKTFMAFELEPEAISTFFSLLLLHQIAVLAGILTLWFGSDQVVAWFSNKEWFHNASGYSFFVFGLHVPLLPYLMKWALLQTTIIPNYRLLCYLFVPFAVICICIWIGKLLHRFFPRFYSVVTGGRGF